MNFGSIFGGEGFADGDFVEKLFNVTFNAFGIKTHGQLGLVN